MTAWDVHRLPMADPGDVSAIDEAIAAGTIDAGEVVGIISQTEGTGYARSLTLLQLSLMLGRHLDQPPDAVVAAVPMMMIGLCGGLMSPHHTVITRSDVSHADWPEPRLAVGVASTRDLDPTELGTPAQVDLVAEAARAAVADGGMGAADVTCVQVKCPAMTPARAEAVARTGRRVTGGGLAAGSAMSKAACALGVAVALGETPASAIACDVINDDPTLYTNRGSVSAGGEQTACRVLAFGNSPTSASRLRSGCGVMADQLDTTGVLDALRAAGIPDPGSPLAPDDAARVRQVFVNCGADLTTHTRGRRHTMGSDFLAGDAGVVAKAVANAVVASVVGDPMILCSAGAEHQGPPGSNLITAIVEVDQ